LNSGPGYAEGAPAKTHVVLIADLYEGGDAQAMLARVAALKQSGVNMIVLLAL
jgi:hypothetical protein